MARATINERRFYVYVIFRLTGIPCYVGKGYGHRWREHSTRSRNAHLRNIYCQAGCKLPVVIVRNDLTEAEAFETEKAFIAAIGREPNGPLVNLTDGGDGPSGFKASQKVKKLIGEDSRARWADPEQRAKIIAAQNAGKSTPEFKANRSRASRRTWSDPERRSAMSEAHKRMHADAPQLRVLISKRTKEAMADPRIRMRLSVTQKLRFTNPDERQRSRDRSLGRKHTEETKAKIAAAHTGKKRSPEARAKMSAWQIGRKMSDEAREKMRVSALARWAKKRLQDQTESR